MNVRKQEKYFNVKYIFGTCFLIFHVFLKTENWKYTCASKTLLQLKLNWAALAPIIQSAYWFKAIMNIARVD